jgi:hypothetical protein
MQVVNFPAAWRAISLANARFAKRDPVSINKHAACAVVLSVRRIRDAHDVEFCG